MANAVPRMNLHLRIQHGFLILTTLLTLATGIGINLGTSFPGIAFSSWYRTHIWSGLTAGVLVTYHIVYLLTRGYVEGRNWYSFPLAWQGSDSSHLRTHISYLLGKKTEKPEANIFRPTQKALYWSTGFLLLGITASGIVISYWEFFRSQGFLANLGLLAHVHRGLSLILLGIVVWHLYGVLTLDGRWKPQWSWLTGNISEEVARAKVPGYLRQYMKMEKERLAAKAQKTAEELELQERKLERGQVETELQEGNRLAKEEKYTEALRCYRRALEVFPGYSQARFNMAVVLRKSGEKLEAIDQFRQFVKNDPFHPLAQNAQEFIEELEREAGR